MADRLDQSQADFTKELARAIVADTMQAIVDARVEQVRESLSEDFPPASVRGESPHRRTGRLQGGVSGSVTQEGGQVTTTFNASAPYAATLELSMERPIFGPIRAELAQSLLQEVAAQMRERF